MIGTGQRGGRSIYRRAGKRAMDLAVALTLLPLIVPVVAGLYLLVRLDGGPGFFGHWRVGRDGRPFRCWKLRSMRPDADVVLARLLARSPEARHEWQTSFRLRDDPRVTRIGHVLRQLHLDEMPQIWNVLLGQMSLVGPRPVTHEELRFYFETPAAYLDLRPGVTGLWQVEARHLAGYGARTELDRAYLASMSLSLDLRLMLRTSARMLGIGPAAEPLPAPSPDAQSA